MFCLHVLHYVSWIQYSFYLRDAMLARVLAIIVCLSVYVCLSHASIVLKWLNIGSRKQRCMIA